VTAPFSRPSNSIAYLCVPQPHSPQRSPLAVPAKSAPTSSVPAQGIRPNRHGSYGCNPHGAHCPYAWIHRRPRRPHPAGSSRAPRLRLPRPLAAGRPGGRPRCRRHVQCSPPARAPARARLRGPDVAQRGQRGGLRRRRRLPPASADRDRGRAGASGWPRGNSRRGGRLCRRPRQTAPRRSPVVAPSAPPSPALRRAGAGRRCVAAAAAPYDRASRVELRPNRTYPWTPVSRGTASRHCLCRAAQLGPTSGSRRRRRRRRRRWSQRRH
jgi:hypothetical protein